MQQDTCILALDCATGPCSVALWRSGRVAAYLEDDRPSVQSARLLPMVEQLLAGAGITYKNLTAVACTVGPGSFTGIRIGLAAARGIAYAAGIPGMGFTTLETMAFSLRAAADDVFAVLNAGKGEWYCQCFSGIPSWRATCDPSLVPPEAALRMAPEHASWAGNVLHEEKNIIPASPRADALAELAATAPHALPLVPFYIRPPDVTMPKAKK